MHQFASWTYSWSLWWLDVNDYNNLMSYQDLTAVTSWNPGQSSFVIAEDSGMYADRRQPGTLGLNYHIQEVEFMSLAPTSKTHSTSMLTGKFTILEPYGVTLLETLIMASFDGTKFNNYADQPYMLQLDFHGYDDNGNSIPAGQSNLYRKRFPIKIQTMEIDVTQKGTQYRCEFVPASHDGIVNSVKYGTLPIPIVANGVKTVDDFFTQFAEQLNKFWSAQALENASQFADTIKFDIDPSIGKSSVVYSKELPLGATDPELKNLDLNSTTFKIPQSTRIIDVVTKIMAHSKYLQDQLGAGTQTEAFNAFRTGVSVQYGAGTASGIVDEIRNVRPRIITFSIRQYSSYAANHPSIGQLADSSPYTVKSYNYYYTGQNTDILGLKINFDSSYYQNILKAPYQMSTTESTQSTFFDSFSNNLKMVMQTPTVLRALNPGAFGQLPTVTPYSTKPIVNNLQLTQGMNIAYSPKAQQAMDVLHNSIYQSAASMISIDLSIVGDPTFIKQDDWLYIPSPNNGSIYNNWPSTTQSQYVQLYGHMLMDAFDVVVDLVINTPLDLDTDVPGVVNIGSVYPRPNTTKSMFSGQYRVIAVNNKFANGKFTQDLTLVRYMNQEQARVARTINESTSNRTAATQVQTASALLSSSVATNQSAPTVGGTSVTETPVDVVNKLLNNASTIGTTQPSTSNSASTVYATGRTTGIGGQ